MKIINKVQDLEKKLFTKKTQTPASNMGNPSTVMEELIEILGEIVDKTENVMELEK